MLIRLFPQQPGGRPSDVSRRHHVLHPSRHQPPAKTRAFVDFVVALTGDCSSMTPRARDEFFHARA